MYTEASATFRECMKSNRGIMTSRLTFDMGGNDLVIGADGIVSVEESSASTRDEIRFGSLVLPTMTFRLLKDKYNVSNLDLRGKEVLWEIGIKPDESSEFEFVPVCRLTTAKSPPVKSGEELQFTADSKLLGKLDQLYTASQGTTKNRDSIIADISQQLGYTINVGRSGSFSLPSVPKGYTFREVLCAIAEYDGMFICVDRDDDTLMFKWYADSSVIVADSIPEDVLGDMQLTDSDERYGGISCPTPSEVLTEGTEPYLILENALGQFDGRQFRVSELLPRVTALVCRTGRIEMQLGNILYDAWDTIYSVPDRHNIINCTAPSQTTPESITIHKNNDGSYTLSGTASDICWISLDTTNIENGQYRIKSSIVDPTGEAHGKVNWGRYFKSPTAEAFYGFDIDLEVFDVPGALYPENYSYVSLALYICKGTTLDSVVIRPMITHEDDNFDQWEQYKPDLTLPLCQISHRYDGGLSTVINIPEITQSEDGAETYTGAESREEREVSDVTKLYQDVNDLTEDMQNKADKSELNAKADESDLQALELRVEYLEQHGTGGASVSRLIRGNNLRASIQGNLYSEVST